MIEFQNVKLHYHYDKYPLLEDLSFTLHEGVNTVLCDIQSGKTSICNLILGEILPTSGQILFDGKNINPDKKAIISALYLPQNPVFFRNRSVLYNLQYPLKVRKVLSQNAQTVSNLAQKFHLTDLLKQKVKQLSLAQQKLLALARGLTVNRDLVLFDGFFDDNSLQGILSLPDVLSQLSAKTVVIFTTNPQLAQGHTVVLDGGKCIYQGDSSTAQQTVADLQWLASKI